MIAIVLAVDRGFAHARAVRSLSTSQRREAFRASQHGYLRLLPSRGRWPSRYVVTSLGSHAIRTFAMCSDDLLSEIHMCRRKLAREREDRAFGERNVA